MDGTYALPELPYKLNALEPFISEQQLTIHYQKHHQAYVNGANAILERLDKARKENIELDMKATLKELSFNIAGHVLHSLFWDNLSPSGGKPAGTLLAAIEKEFGSFERLKTEFSKAAASVEGSGWAALAFDKETGRLIIMQIEKHNVNLVPGVKLLLVLDVFEHAYYLDYKNDRAKYVENFWSIVNWDEANKRFES